MTHASKLLGAAGVVALFALGASPAYASGTLVGTTITNTVTVNFSVSGVAQTATTASNAVVVDRKVALTMTTAATTTTVAPGQNNAAYAFTVTNSSNDTLDFGLAATAQTSGATAQHGGTSTVTATTFTYYLDNGSGAPGTQITWLDEVPPDTTKTVWVEASIPSTATNAQIAGIVLTATAEAGGASGTQGAVLTASTGAWTPGTVQTVFADGSGNGGDAQYDGKYAIKGDYTISAPVLTVTKLSTIISDPFETSNPKAVPGAVMEYCIVVSNAAGAATATNLAITDPLPATVTYNSGTGILLNGTYNTSTSYCNSDGTSGGTYTTGTPNTVAGTLNNLAAGATETLRFRVTIN